MPAATTVNQEQISTLNIHQEIAIAAPIETAWEAVLDQMGPKSEMPDGKPFPFKLEAWPGGRLWRDLGNDTGHLWGYVQVIKPPKLLEIFGPCYMSYPATNHIQYRLTPEGDGTRLKITNRAFGYMPKDFMVGVEIGWEHGLKHVADIAARMLKNSRKGK